MRERFAARSLTLTFLMKKLAKFGLLYLLAALLQSKRYINLFYSNLDLLTNQCHQTETLYTLCDINGVTSAAGGTVLSLTTTVTFHISYCNFTNCSSTSNGGVCSITGEWSQIYIDYCRFVFCTALNDGSGGAIYQYANCSIVKSRNSYFETCSSGEAGGVFFLKLGELHTTDCVFINCWTQSASGGCIFDYGNLGTNTHTVITSCLARNCSAYRSAGGGFFFLRYGTGVLQNCQLFDCATDGGGAIYQTFIPSYCVVENCLFSNCSSISSGEDYCGGGFCSNGGTTRIGNCGFEMCTSLVNGGAICFNNVNPDGSECSVNITDCWISDCKSGKYGGAIYIRRPKSSVRLENIKLSMCTSIEASRTHVYITNTSIAEISGLCVASSEGEYQYHWDRRLSDNRLLTKVVKLHNCSTDTFTQHYEIRNSYCILGVFVYGLYIFKM